MEGIEDDIGPDEFLCPITLELMTDPVLAEDGHTYERSAITDWFANGNGLSPKTQARMGQLITPNFALKAMIAGRSQRTEASIPDLPIREWLVGANPILGSYAAAFAGYGYETTSILAAAELTDLLEAFEDIKVKKPHRRLVLTAFDALRGGAS